MALTGNPYVTPTDLPDMIGGKLRYTLVDGANNGNVTLTGIRVEDKVVAAINLTDLADNTSELTVIGTDIIKFGTQNHSGDKILVIWLDLQ